MENSENRDLTMAGVTDQITFFELQKARNPSKYWGFVYHPEPTDTCLLLYTFIYDLLISIILFGFIGSYFFFSKSSILHIYTRLHRFSKCIN